LRNKDWTLVFFTSLSQLSVGIVLCFTWLVYINNDARSFIVTGLSLQNPALLALISAGVATGISFLHLGKPSNAPNAMNNLAESWISREILALAMYSLSLLITLASGWENWNAGYPEYLLSLSSVLGLVFLWMMTRIYVIPTIPPWNSWYTGLSFASTALCLGLITILLLYYIGFMNVACATPHAQSIDNVACVTRYARFTNDPTTKLLMISLTITLLIEIISTYYHQARLEKMNTGIDDLVLDNGPFYQIFLIRMVMLFVALLALFVFLLKPTLFPGNNFLIWMFPLLALLIAQELTGRLLFYSSYFRIGV